MHRLERGTDWTPLDVEMPKDVEMPVDFRCL